MATNIDKIQAKLIFESICSQLPESGNPITDTLDASLCLEAAKQVHQTSYLEKKFNYLETRLQKEKPDCFLSYGGLSLTHNKDYSLYKHLGLSTDPDFGGKDYGNGYKIECVPLMEAGFGRIVPVLAALFIESQWHPVEYLWDAAMDTYHGIQSEPETPDNYLAEPVAQNRQEISRRDLLATLNQKNRFPKGTPRKRPAAECDNDRKVSLTHPDGYFKEDPVALFNSVQANPKSVPYIEKYAPNEIIMLPEPITLHHPVGSDSYQPMTYRQVSINYAASFLNYEELGVSLMSTNYQDAAFREALHAVILIETADCEIIGLSHFVIDQTQFSNKKKYPVLLALRAIKFDPEAVYDDYQVTDQDSSIRVASVDVKRTALGSYLVRLLTLQFHEFLKPFERGVDYNDPPNRTIVTLIEPNLLTDFRKKLGLTTRELDNDCWTEDTLVSFYRPEDDVTICEAKKVIKVLQTGYKIPPQR